MKRLILLISFVIIFVAIIIFVPFRQPSFIGYVYKVDKNNDITIVVGDNEHQSMDVLIREGASRFKSGQKVKVFYENNNIDTSFPIRASAKLTLAKQDKEQFEAISQLFTYYQQKYEKDFYPIIHSIEHIDEQWTIQVTEIVMSSEFSSDEKQTYSIDEAGNVLQLERDRIQNNAVTIPKATDNNNMPLEVTPSLEHATELGKWLVDALKQSDESRLAELLAAHKLDEQQLEKITQAFHHNFSLESLSIHANENGISMSPVDGQFEFEISADETNELPADVRRLVVQYRSDGTIMFHHPYITYFPNAEQLVNDYIQAIRDKDTMALMKVLTVDDIDIPSSVAQQIIMNYRDQFDLSTIEVMYDHHFYFNIFDANGQEHQIELVYGDGLMGVNDAYSMSFS